MHHDSLTRKQRLKEGLGGHWKEVEERGFGDSLMEAEGLGGLDQI